MHMVIFVTVNNDIIELHKFIVERGKISRRKIVFIEIRLMTQKQSGYCRHMGLGKFSKIFRNTGRDLFEYQVDISRQ